MSVKSLQFHQLTLKVNSQWYLLYTCAHAHILSFYIAFIIQYWRSTTPLCDANLRQFQKWHLLSVIMGTISFLSLHFNGHFPGEPGLAGVYWSKLWWRWWWKLELYVVQSSSQVITTNKPTSGFLQAGCPSCRPTNSVKALKGKISHSMDLLTPSSPGVFQLCLWPLIAPGYLGGGLPCLSSTLWCQYP